VTHSVLVVAEEANGHEDLSGVLGSLGCGVETVADDERAGVEYDRRPYDAVLVDADGIRDGLALCSKLIAADPTASTVIMTSRSDQQMAVRALNLGVRGFLRRPFTQEQLSEVLERVFDEHQSGVERQLLLGGLMRKRTELLRRVEEQGRDLATTENYLRHLLNAVPYAIISAGVDGSILTFNGLAEEWYRSHESEALGMPVATFFNPEAEDGERTSHTRRNGESFPVRVQRRSIVDRRGEAIAHLYVIEDLSEAEKMEAQLLQADRLALLGRLAPRIAHEFKTPLQLINGYAELALTWLEGNDLSQAAACVQRIPPASEQMASLVQQMSKLGKPAEVTEDELDLCEELDRIVGTLRSLGVVKRCDLVTEWPDGVPAVKGDRSQVEQVFRNLIVNAAQAMEESVTRRLHIAVQALDDGNWVEARVRDTGPGIAPEHIDTVFQPFFTTKPEGKGTGLGLPIVKSVMDRHGGSIRVESEPGRGSDFVVGFPACA